jgi:hypothetical protein
VGNEEPENRIQGPAHCRAFFLFLAQMRSVIHDKRQHQHEPEEKQRQDRTNRNSKGEAWSRKGTSSTSSRTLHEGDARHCHGIQKHGRHGDPEHYLVDNPVQFQRVMQQGQQTEEHNEQSTPQRTKAQA